MSAKTVISTIILTLVMTFMEMTAIPAALFCDIKFYDVEPVYFALMANFLIAFALCFLYRKFLVKYWYFGLGTKGLSDGLRKHIVPAIVATVISAAAFCIGLMPFDNKPTFWKVAIEGVVYYVGVAIMEELYLRGLLQNFIERSLDGRKNASLYAIFISSILFGLGHVFGALDQPVLTIVCKTVWACALGVFFGAIYVATRNLWVPIILHFIVDLCGIPYCFKTTNQYPTAALITCLVVNILLAVYGIYVLVQSGTGPNCTKKKGNDENGNI